MIAPTRRRPLALVAATLLAGLMALPLIAAAPASAQARDISNACQGAPQSDFPDRGNPAQAAAIDCIAGYGITAGKADGSYGTNDPVQRDQMATFLVRKILLVSGNNLPAAPAQNQFPCDVRATNAAGQPNPHYEPIQRLASTTNPQIAQGGPGGQPDDCFGPTQPVRRGQMATFIVRQLQFLGVTLPSNPPNAFDDDNGHPHEANINIVAALGIAQGTSARRFQPQATTTRGQMAFFLSRDLSVLVEANKLTNRFGRGVTSQPELVSASFVATSGSGTTVRFTFDQDVATATVNSAEFFVHQSDNTRFAGSTGTIESGGRSVLVNFAGITTTAAGEQLTLATVDDGAVTLSTGVTNPEGDAAIGNAATTPNVQPGVTTAPDLLSIENPRVAQQPHQTAVDFVFDQPAFRTTSSSGGFALIHTTAGEIVCTAPDPGSTTAGGGTSPGGEGTTRITVVCTNPGQSGLPVGPTITMDNIVRGTVAQGTVASTAGQTSTGGAANQNPLQASDTPHKTGANGGRGPDLVSATFTSGTGGGTDSVVYTFDQTVATSTGAATLFRVYGTNGVETVGSTANPPVVNTANPTQVLVSFPSGTLTNAVGASVRDAAVTGTGSTSANENVANQQDEVPASLGGSTTRTPGQTAGPNLTGVALSRPNNPFGMPGDFVATYTFDEAVTLQTAAQAGAATQAAGQTLFHLFTSGGVRYTSRTCSVGSGANNNQVTCTAYNVGSSSTAATSEQIGGAVLGTVDFAAVFGANGAQTNAVDRNPEGAAPTTGGTGTAAS